MLPRFFIKVVGAFLKCNGTAGCDPSFSLMISLALDRALADSLDFGALARYVTQ